MDKKNEVTLFVNGERYRGWTSVSLTASLMSLARACTLSATRSSTSDNLCKGIEPGLSAQLKIGDDVVLTGYIVKNVLSYAADDISITIEIKSKTVDLEQCSIPYGKEHSWKNSSISSVIEKIAGYYGIGVISNNLGKERKSIDIEAHGPLFSGLIKIIKNNSLLVTDDGAGRLVIMSIGSATQECRKLESGKNILEGKREWDTENVFKHYVVIGQGADPNSERANPGNALKGQSNNGGMERDRWIVMSQTGSRTAAELQQRADLLMTNSIGGADKFTYKLQGWRQANGDLWEPGMKVYSNDSLLDFSGCLIVESVTYTLDQNGSTTVLSLKAPEAFTVTDLPEKEAVAGTKIKKVVAKIKNGTTFLSKAGSGKL